MNHPKTYFILPTTVYRPDDLIRLGQVITDPRVPYDRLTLPNPLKGPLTPRISTTIEWSARSTKTHNASVGSLAHVVGIITADASGSSSHSETQTWEAAYLETQFIELNEDPNYVQNIVKVDAVEQWLKHNHWKGRSAYIITGLKIARNAGEVTFNNSSTLDVEGKLLATVDPWGVVEGGANASHGRSNSVSEKGKVESAYVFAYRLRKIHVTWRSKAKLGEYLRGGSLYGTGYVSSEEEDGDEDEDENWEEDLDLEIQEALIEEDDFGISMSAKEIDTNRVEEANGYYTLIRVRTP